MEDADTEKNKHNS